MTHKHKLTPLLDRSFDNDQGDLAILRTGTTYAMSSFE